jgi:arylsulfatase
MKAPNILLITTDHEQSFVDLPAGLVLPGHERLRERSLAFRNFQVNTTPCGPSRSVIYSGQHTQKTRLFVNPNVPPHPELPRDMPTLGSIFGELGYYPVYKGKWHLSNLNHGINFDQQRYPETSRALEPWGFHEYTMDGDHHGIAWEGFKQDGAIAADAANWLLGNSGSKPDDTPWLLAVNFVNPHDIMFYDATGTMTTERLDPVRVAPLMPAPWAAPYQDDLGFDLPTSFNDDLNLKPSAHRDDQRMADLMYGRLPAGDEQAWRNHRNYYFNCIRDVDRHVCTVLDALASSGDADNTIIVFTSDHGEMAGAHGMRQKGASMYKENVRVSCFISHPDLDKGCETDRLATSIDLIPTLVELAQPGIDWQERWPLAWDIDFVETLFKGQVRGEFTEQEKARMSAGQALDGFACYRGINDGRYKFARYFKPAEHHQPNDWATLCAHNELELYDTAADPHEVSNLANHAEDHRALILDLNERLNQLIATEIGIDDGSYYSSRRNYSLEP